MSGLTKTGSDRKKQNDTTQNSEEVRIIGKVSRLYLHGKLLYPITKSDEIEPPRPKKKSSKRYVLLPVEDKNSAVEFIKVPMYKVHKKFESKYIRSVDIRKVNSVGYETSIESVPLWRAAKDTLPVESKGNIKSMKPREQESALREYTYEPEITPTVSKTTRKEYDSSPKVIEQTKSSAFRTSVERYSGSYRESLERRSGSYRESVERRSGSYRESMEKKLTSYHDSEGRKIGINSPDFLNKREAHGSQNEEQDASIKGKTKTTSPKKEKKKTVLKKKKTRKDED